MNAKSRLIKSRFWWSSNLMHISEKITAVIQKVTVFEIDHVIERAKFYEEDKDGSHTTKLSPSFRLPNNFTI